MINSLPAGNGLSPDLSPATLITGNPPVDYHEAVKLNIDDFFQVHTTNTLFNNNESRSTGAIALYPSGNEQYSWMYMSLLIEERLHRYQWTVMPAYQEVLDRFCQLALAQNQPLVVANFKY